MAERSKTPVIVWLFLCATLVACMVVVGGLTRLTESGLSIVEWKPISGIFPPMSEEGWQQEFEAYQTSPQYQKINKGMTALEFQGIFWLEYLHRLLGRLVGLVFFLPLVFFWVTKRLEKPLALKLTGIFLLGGVQGVVGWYMVKSGLIHDPWVSPIRLAFHLGLAFIIFALLLWQVLNLCESAAAETSPRLYMMARLASAAIFLQVLLGALVAGLDAGLTYNTYPLMDGKWIPDGLWQLHPLYINFFENITMVQFNHRMVAKILGIFLVFYAWIGYTSTQDRVAKRLFVALVAVFVVQFALGVLTLIKAVPILLATLHQLNALVLFAVSVGIVHRLRKYKEKPVVIPALPQANL